MRGRRVAPSCSQKVIAFGRLHGKSTKKDTYGKCLPLKWDALRE